MGRRQLVTRVRADGRPARARRRRPGLTLVEVVVAMAILGGVLLSLSVFAVRLSQATSGARIGETSAQLAADRIEATKGSPRYTAIESLFVATEGSISGYPGYTRQTWVSHVGGQVADTIDYKVVTVQVSNTALAGNVRKTTVVAPY